MPSRTLALVAVLLALPLSAEADGPPYQKYSELLSQYVNDQGMVDYAAFKKNDEQTLRDCVKDMERTAESFERNKPSEKYVKTLYINAYNAVTLQAMLEFYPLKSIKDKSGKKYDVWKHYTFGKKKLSLNDIEHKILRPMGDPRIHAAIVCASKGCPILLDEAYVPNLLDDQLDKNMRKWLKDPKRGLKLSGDTLHLSEIFNWFATDFGKNRAAQLNWIAQYADKSVANRIRGQRPLKVKYLNWDWTLNKQ